MLEITGNLWDFHNQGNAICITTNGFVKSNGQAVMGRGIAKQAAQRYTRLPREFGERLGSEGNHVMYFPDYNLYTFPVKHNWWEAADLDLISRSVKELEGCIEVVGHKLIYLPRPGCENGRRTWQEVRPYLAHLDDRFVVCDWNA